MEDDDALMGVAVIIVIALAVAAAVAVAATAAEVADETTKLLLRLIGETANARTVVDVNRVARQSIQINVGMLWIKNTSTTAADDRAEGGIQF